MGQLSQSVYFRKSEVKGLRIVLVSLFFQIAALKCQMDNDAHTIEKISGEKSLLQGQIGELQAKIRTLEGQVSEKKTARQLNYIRRLSKMVHFKTVWELRQFKDGPQKCFLFKQNMYRLYRKVTFFYVSIHFCLNATQLFS